MPEYLGPLALGIFIGAVAVLVAAYYGVDIGQYPSRRINMKDCFDKPIKVVSAFEIRPGDFIHDIYDRSSLLDIEKRKGYVISIASEIEGGIILRLVGRKTPLEVPVDANAVITRASLSASPRQAQASPPAMPRQARASAFNLLPKQPDEERVHA